MTDSTGQPLESTQTPQTEVPLKQLPPFEGGREFLQLLGALSKRPSFRDNPRSFNTATRRWGESHLRSERSARKGLPMVCLVHHSTEALEALKSVQEKFHRAKPQAVQSAYISLKDENKVEPEANDWSTSTVEAVRKILSDIEEAFTRDAKTKNPKLKFTRFRLVNWLMTREPPNISGPNREREILAAIRRYNVAQSSILSFVAGIFQNDAEEKAQGILDTWAASGKMVKPIPLKGLILLGQVISFLLFWVRTLGSSKILSQKYWWFMHQPHLAPEMSGKFSRFALRLTREEWHNEAPEYVARLLVNAFLEDLRAAYKIRPLEFLKPRRSTYPVVLLNNITSTNGGFRLLELINVVRNQTGQFDPLLVITAGRETPPYGTTKPENDGTTQPENRRKYLPLNALNAYEVWQGQLLRDRRARRDTAWYLPLTLPGIEDQGQWPSIGEMDEFTARRRHIRPGRWMSRVNHTSLIVLLVAGAIVFPVQNYLHTIQEHCGTHDPDLVRVRSSVASRWTCIGVTTDGRNLFDPPDREIKTVEATVKSQNQRAIELHRDFPNRPYITLIALWALTSADHTSASLTADRESLEGLAVAQKVQQGKTSSSDPIVRILVANAGPDMSDGVLAAKKIADEEHRDNSVAAVVGLDMSSSNTEETIRELTRSGIPMIASTLSADDLTSLSKLYFQVSPRNSREAAVAANFVKSLLPNTFDEKANSEASSTASKTVNTAEYRVKIFYSNDPADTYSKNLAADAKKQFTHLRFKTQALRYTPSDTTGLDPSARAAGMSTCGQSKEYVFFAGRGDPDFRSFMDGARQCGSKAVVIGGDDVSRFVAGTTSKTDLGYPTYYYVSFASISTDTNKKRRPPNPSDFYQTLKELFPFEESSQSSSDGHAALAYDAAQVAITAASYLASGPTLPVSPGAEWREITAIGQPGSHSRNNSYLGISGRINYRDGNQQYPEKKEVQIRRVDGVKGGNTQVAICGDPQDSEHWCPDTN